MLLYDIYMPIVLAAVTTYKSISHNNSADTANPTLLDSTPLIFYVSVYVIIIIIICIAYII